MVSSRSWSPPLPKSSPVSKWFDQNFPKEPPPPDVASDLPAESKYKYDDLLAFVQN